MTTFQTVIIVRDHVERFDLIGKTLKSPTIDTTDRPDVELTCGAVPQLRCDSKHLSEYLKSGVTLAFSTLPVSDLMNCANKVFIIQGDYFRITYPVPELVHNPFHRRFIRFTLVRAAEAENALCVEERKSNTERKDSPLFLGPMIWEGNPDDLVAIYRQKQLSSSTVGVLPPSSSQGERTYCSETYDRLRRSVASRLRQASPPGYIPALVRIIELSTDPLLQDFLAGGGCLETQNRDGLPSSLRLTLVSEEPISHWRANLAGLPGKHECPLGPEPWFSDVVEAVRRDLVDAAAPDLLDMGDSRATALNRWNVGGGESAAAAAQTDQGLLGRLFPIGTPDSALISELILKRVDDSNGSAERIFLDCMLWHSSNDDPAPRRALWRLVSDIASTGGVRSPDDRFKEPEFRISQTNNHLTLTHRNAEIESTTTMWTLLLPLQSIVRRATINVLDDTDARLGADFVLD